MKARTKSVGFIFPLLFLFSFSSLAQPTWTFDPFGKEKKPEQYEDKKLGSELTAEKKFTTFRRVIQNGVTHYNFYFNANNKLRDVVERAKQSQKDDYTNLLSFYPYSLENTAAQQVELDSVIYKATGGILLHDLRSDWVDNMYLLIGKAYYYRKVLDSAALTFQFINYNLFPRKKNEDDNRIVGTNAQTGTGNLSIANKETPNIAQKIFSLPPSRNDALIWLIRTCTEMERFGDAAGIINILQQDPNLPSRLKNDLEEVTAYWFYKQQLYDSSAIHLEKGITAAANNGDKSRWQYLIGQMYEITGDYDKASDYFAKSSKLAIDPAMEIYAEMNNAKMGRTNATPKDLDNSIDALLKMARKDKYEAYRDILFHYAGMLSLKKHDTTNAVAYMEKSLGYNESNESFKNKSHLQLGKIAYEQQQYRKAADHYDSLDIQEPSIFKDSADIATRKVALRKLADELNIISREDSLQMIAAMPAAERDEFIKKLSKKYKKEKGVSSTEDNQDLNNNALSSFDNKKNQSTDLFESSSKGEWYFYNASSKSRGFSEFKSKWGKRENIDNWRRNSALKINNLNNNIDIDAPLPSDSLNAQGAAGEVIPYSYDALMGDLPLTPEKIDSSNERIAVALISLAKVFEYDLEDYQQAIFTYELYLQRFPNRLDGGSVYLGLYHCYIKLGDKNKAEYYKKMIDKEFADSRYAKMINNPQALELQKDGKNPEVTQRYAQIYELFIEGNFTRALEEKQKADSLYGNTYWTPQLLYIEAVHYIKEKNDSAAITVLSNIVSLYPESPLNEKASVMIGVLNRRAEIEAYLTNLEVTRVAEDEKVIIADDKVVEPVKTITAPVVTAPKIVQPVRTVTVPRDSSIALPPTMVSGGYKWQAGKPHQVVMLLDRVDAVYVNEAKNAFGRFNREKNYSKVQINKENLDATRSMLVFASFDDATTAMAYLTLIKKAAPVEVSWLQAGKYSFFPITAENLELLKTNKDLEVYKQLLNNQYPGQF